MPDITMCQRSDCPRAATCYRFMATPDERRQSYSNFEPDGCEYYLPITDTYYRSNHVGGYGP